MGGRHEVFIVRVDLMTLKSFLYLFVLLGVYLEAARPDGVYRKTKQLDVEKLEKDLSSEFSIPFPGLRYDIDSFHKGDLVTFGKGAKTVLVTCPFVSGEMISLGFGSGTDAESYQMKGDLTVNWTQDRGILSIYVLSSIPNEIAPGVGVRPSRQVDETNQAFFNRVKNYWLKRVSEKKTKLTAAEINVAFKVLAVALQQKPALKVSHVNVDPTLETEFQGK